MDAESALRSHPIVRASIELLIDTVLYVGVLLLVIMLLGQTVRLAF
jgi:hypothetical protein